MSLKRPTSDVGLARESWQTAGTSMKHLVLVILAACGGGNPAPAADAPATADTWASWAQSFTMTYCSASCHAPGGSGAGGGAFDFTQYANVYANRAAIRCGVSAIALSGCTGSPAPKQFPIAAPYPSDADRARIVAWIDAGATQ
jgi:hypothetical protein